MPNTIHARWLRIFVPYQKKEGVYCGKKESQCDGHKFIRRVYGKLARKAVGLSLEIPEVRILRTRPTFMAISFVEPFIRIALSRAYEAE